MLLYHGTKVYGLEARQIVADFPIATKAANGLGFYLTDNKEIALEYGNLIEYEVPNDWTCALMRPIEVYMEKGIEYVLTQHEADALVVDHAICITIHQGGLH